MALSESRESLLHFLSSPLNPDINEYYTDKSPLPINKSRTKILRNKSKDVIRDRVTINSHSSKKLQAHK